MIILHGYLLEGSGSNLWTRAIIRTLCLLGKTVHLMCQDPHPEAYDFISEVWKYPINNSSPILSFKRSIPYPGECIMHKPDIGDVLPVYVRDKYEEFEQVVPMVELDNKSLENYLSWNLKALELILAKYPIKIIHANHAVLMSVVALRASEKANVPFIIMPHGSAIEYAVKKDERLHNLALQAFSHASQIFTISSEMQERLVQTFPQIKHIRKKTQLLNLGVDTSLFSPLAHDQRKNSIEKLGTLLRDQPRGKTVSQMKHFEKALSTIKKYEDLIEIIEEFSNYELKFPDEAFEEWLLGEIPWNSAKILLFVGRLILTKGFHLILAALPLILSQHPLTFLIIIGHGPLRELLQAFLWALSAGNKELAIEIIESRAQKGSSITESLGHLQHFFSELKKKNQLDYYFEQAQHVNVSAHVLFTGYLTHEYLRYIFPCADIAIFPSIIAEAGPLVFLEAMASGTFPMGMYFAGMKVSIDSANEVLPEDVVELMKIRQNADHSVLDIMNNVNNVLSMEKSVSNELRTLAVRKYDWKNIAKIMLKTFDQIYNSPPK
ncbi:MAG: glycosyltransferase [Candidatus Hodarchaeota archaeon]